MGLYHSTCREALPGRRQCPRKCVRGNSQLASQPESGQWATSPHLQPVGKDGSEAGAPVTKRNSMGGPMGGSVIGCFGVWWEVEWNECGSACCGIWEIGFAVFQLNAHWNGFDAIRTECCLANQRYHGNSLTHFVWQKKETNFLSSSNTNAFHVA